MKVVNLKDDPDGEDTYAPIPMAQYGYGLRICLSNEQCEKLGITTPPKAGTKVSIKGDGIVCTATHSIDDEQGTNVSLSIQITDLGVETNGVERNPAKVIYGKD